MERCQFGYGCMRLPTLQQNDPTSFDYEKINALFDAYLAQGGCEPQLISHAAANMKIGNDKAFLIKIISVNIPFIGYPRSLNALRCVNEAAK